MEPVWQGTAVLMSDSAKEGCGGWLATGVVLAVVFFAYPLGLGIPLIDPDEGLHASIAQEMVERGDWVTPRLVGEPFLDKPVLFTWSQALSLRLLGTSEAAVRLPGLLFALLAMITTGVVGWRLFNRQVGMVGALMYATTLLPTGLAQCASHDVALVPWISLAILLFFESDRAATRGTRIALTLAVGVLLGLACLTKGLVGVALVGITYGSSLLVTRRLTLAACLRGCAALAVAALVASPWYLAMEGRNPGYLSYYFVQRHLLGYATGTQRHGLEPWWYYLPILLIGGLPWISYLPIGARDWWARRNEPGRRASDGAIPLLLCWLIGCTVFLSLAGSKLITYVWPVFPAVAILAAVVWVRLFDGTLSGPARRALGRNFCGACLVGPLLVPVALCVAGHELGIHFPRRAWAAGIAAALASWVPLGFWYAGRPRGALSAGMLAVAAQFAVLMAVAASPLADFNSAGDLARHFNRLGEVPRRVVLVEDRVGSVVFYLDRPLRAGLKPGQLEPVRAIVLPHLPKPAADAVIVVARRRLDVARPYLGLPDEGFRPAGRFRLYRPAQVHFLHATAAAPPDGAIRR